MNESSLATVSFIFKLFSQSYILLVSELSKVTLEKVLASVALLTFLKILHRLKQRHLAVIFHGFCMNLSPLLVYV